MRTDEQWPPPLLEDWREKVRADKSPPWLLEPFVPAAARVWVTGPPKMAKKTWLAFEIVRALASGRQYGFFKPTYKEGINCLVVEKEGTPKFNEWRWAALEKGQQFEVPHNRVRIDFGSSLKLDNPKWKDRLLELVARHNIQFVLIDSLAKCMSGDENSAQDCGKVLDTIDAIRRLGCTVMYLDHLHKIKDKDAEEEDIDEQGRGSSAKAGYYDTHLALRPESKGAEIVKLAVRNRDAPETYFRVVWSISKDLGVAELHMEEFNPNAPISNEMLVNCTEALKVGTVYKMNAITELWKLPRTVASRVLEQLVQGGLITRTASGYRREL